jgi:AcrR family transcriptional regulator
LNTAQTPISGRQRLIEAAAALFARQGFGPVGLDQVISAVGVTKTTFYKHFESKDALILAVLEYQHDLEYRQLVEDINERAGQDPRRKILAIFDVFDDWFGEPDFRGCMFMNAATEFPQATDPIHIAAEHHGQALAAMVRELAIGAGASAAVADRIAPQIMVLLSGALIVRQTANQRDSARVARATAELLLEQIRAGRA